MMHTALFPPTRLLCKILCTAVMGSMLGLALFGQNRDDAHMAYLYPAGGQAGTTFQVQVGGSSLRTITGAILSDGIGTAKLIEIKVPAHRGGTSQLRREIERIVLKDEPNLDVKTLNQRVAAYVRDHPEYKIRNKELSESYMLRQIASDALAEVAIFEVTLSPDAAPGMYRFTPTGRNGLSNPLPFHVDRIPEYVSPSMRESLAQAEAQLKETHLLATRPTQTARVIRPQTPPAFAVSLPVIVNGQVTIAKPDVFSFEAKKGQRIVIKVWARSLIPYISDAVPGWFQPTIVVRDAEGKEVAYCDDYYHEVDPLLSFEADANGEYSVEIKDAVSRGREDFVYRMLIGEVPFVCEVYPLGVRAGEPSVLTLSGWNLPTQTLSFVGTASPRQTLNLRSLGFFQRPLHLQISDESAVSYAALSGKSKTDSARDISLPTIIDGKISHPGQTDSFRFSGKKGQSVSAEVFARRLDSPLDAYLILRDAKGTIIAQNDDAYDDAEGMITHHADPSLIAKLPTDGNYTLTLGDTQGHGADAYAYRLHVSEPRPDFVLQITPSSVNVPRGNTIDITAHATRRGGFDGAIALRVLNAPKGAQFSGMRIPAGATSASFTMTVPFSTETGRTALTMEGLAKTARGEIVHQAQPCENMMQAFYIWHRVPFGEFVLNILPPRNVAPRLEKKGPVLTITPKKQDPVILPRTGTYSLELGTVPQASFKGNPQIVCELASGPEGLSIAKSTTTEGRFTVELSANERELSKATSGNLVFRTYIEQEMPVKSGKRRLTKRYLNTLPAIPYTIAPQEAKVALPTP